MNNLKTKVNYLNIGKLKTVPKDLKKLIDALCKKVIKSAELNKLNTKVNTLENKIPYATI